MTGDKSDYLTDLIEDAQALERAHADGGIPTACQVADFTRDKFGSEGAVELVGELLKNAMVAGQVNAGCFYLCVILELHGEHIGRFARKELVTTMERFWRPKQ